MRKLKENQERETEIVRMENKKKVLTILEFKQRRVKLHELHIITCWSNWICEF